VTGHYSATAHARLMRVTSLKNFHTEGLLKEGKHQIQNKKMFLKKQKISDIQNE
jgi:hypothetical protein